MKDIFIAFLEIFTQSFFRAKVLELLKDLGIKTDILLSASDATNIPRPLVEKKSPVQLNETAKAVLRQYNVENIIKKHDIASKVKNIESERQIYEACMDFTFRIKEIESLIKDIEYENNFLITEIRKMMAVKMRDMVLEKS